MCDGFMKPEVNTNSEIMCNTVSEVAVLYKSECLNPDVVVTVVTMTQLRRRSRVRPRVTCNTSVHYEVSCSSHYMDPPGGRVLVYLKLLPTFTLGRDYRAFRLSILLGKQHVHKQIA